MTNLLKLIPYEGETVYWVECGFFFDKKIPRKFMDFVVDEKPLSPLVNERKFAGAFGSFGNKADKYFAKKYLEPINTGKTSKRVPIYVCPVCGDEGCGGVSVNISVDEKHIIWSDFTDLMDPEDELEDSDELYNIGPFHFEKKHYQKIIEEYLELSASLESGKKKSFWSSLFGK